MLSILPMTIPEEQASANSREVSASDLMSNFLKQKERLDGLGQAMPPPSQSSQSAFSFMAPSTSSTPQIDQSTQSESQVAQPDQKRGLAKLKISSDILKKIQHESFKLDVPSIPTVTFFVNPKSNSLQVDSEETSFESLDRLTAQLRISIDE